jgi:SAM-dependent methyltransferase
MLCRICKNKKDNVEYVAKENMFGKKDKFTYFQCSACSCLQIKEYIENIYYYYGKNYYSYNNTSGIKSTFLSIPINIRNRYCVYQNGLIGFVLHRLKPNINLFNIFNNLPTRFKSNDISILDIGCGAGKFLRDLNNVGFKKLMGVDPFIETDENIKPGFNIFKKNIFDVQETFDLIFFNHSLEHMENQRLVMKHIRKLLNPNGLCVISIPISSSFAFAEYGSDWIQLDAPRHYYLHSVRSMEILTNLADLVIENIIYDSTNFQFWGSELYKKNISLVDPNSKKYINPKLFFTKSKLKEFSAHANDLNLNKLGDQAIFYIKNKERIA